MDRITVGSHVLHKRVGDAHAKVGTGTVIELGGTKATLKWDDSGKTGAVDIRDLRLATDVDDQ